MRLSISSALVLVPLALLVGGCGSSDSSGSGGAGGSGGSSGSGGAAGSAGSSGKHTYVFNGEDEHLNAYDVQQNFKKKVLVTGNEHEELGKGPALNGQICFNPKDHTEFFMGDDEGQALPDHPPGWAIMKLTGSTIDDFAVTRVNKLVPTFQGSNSNSENLGCGYLSDGRMLTSDVGNQGTLPADGQLVVYFPPFDHVDSTKITSLTKHFCKIDVTLGTAGSIWIDSQERIYVASAFGDTAHPAGIYRFTGPFPTGDDAAHGCGDTDAVGSPMATAGTIKKELLIKSDANIFSPISVFGSGHDTLYVASVYTGVIAEYDMDGKFIKDVLKPAAGEKAPTYATGNPNGLGVASDGTIYYADIGLQGTLPDVGPGDHIGSVRQLGFVDGKAQAPVTMDTGLNFPDGIGILEQ